MLDVEEREYKTGGERENGCGEWTKGERRRKIEGRF
jgi:hypothetical protein